MRVYHYVHGPKRQTRWTFVGKVMFLLFNMLSRLVITFFPRSKHLLISWLQSLSAVIWSPKKIKSDTVSTVSPSIAHEIMGPDAMIFVFWMLSFKPTFSLSTFPFIKRLFSSSSLSAIRVVSSAYLRLWFFQWLCMDVRVGLWRKLSTEELMLLNCGVGEDSWESLGLQGDPTSPSQRRSVLGVHWKDWCWSWNSNTLATWCEELTHWKRPWCWEGLGAGGEGDDRGWDGWMASPTQWTRVWVDSGSWWWTGRPGVLRFMGSQRVGHDWATELNWTTFSFTSFTLICSYFPTFST